MLRSIPINPEYVLTNRGIEDPSKIPQRRGSGKITSLFKETASIRLDSVQVQGGNLEATVELVTIDGEQNPSALICFGGPYSIKIELLEDYQERYTQILSDLRKGNYEISLKPSGTLDISFGDKK